MTDEQLGANDLSSITTMYSTASSMMTSAAAYIAPANMYAINYVYSGEMILDNGNEQIHVGKGECVFIPRDHHITMYKKTKDGRHTAVSS